MAVAACWAAVLLWVLASLIKTLAMPFPVGRPAVRGGVAFGAALVLLGRLAASLIPRWTLVEAAGLAAAVEAALVALHTWRARRSRAARVHEELDVLAQMQSRR